MSYKVLSLKLRPHQFNQIVGQIHVTRTLQNAIGLDRVAHGYIFSGPRGVGKTTTARILAKVLNCKQPLENNPCGTCTNCVEIKKGSSLDVQELDGASNRGIDEMRDLREAVKYPPNSSKYRIYIIDEVHMLTREAFNALLKTLEEPPPHVIFIMATTDAHKIPPTILSRTQKFDFKHISINDIYNYLSKVLEKENIKYDKEGVYLIAQKAEGSLRDALSLLDQVIAYAGQSLDIEIVRDVLGIIKENIFLKLIQALETNNNKVLVQELIKLIDDGYSISDFISGFNNYLRNCMIQKTDSSSNVNLSDESLHWLNSSCHLSTDNFLTMLEQSLQFESKLRFIQHPQISLEALFLKLSMISSNTSSTYTNKNSAPLKDNNSILNITDDEIEKDESPKVPETIVDPIQSNALDQNVNKKTVITTDDEIKNVQPQKNTDSNITLDDFKSNWLAIIEKLELTNSKIANFLEDIQLCNFENNQLLIKLVNGHKFQLKALEKDVEQIETVINNKFDKKIKIKFDIDNQSEKKNEQKVSSSTEHPLFIKTLEVFEGEIIR